MLEMERIPALKLGKDTTLLQPAQCCSLNPSEVKPVTQWNTKQCCFMTDGDKGQEQTAQ